MHLNPLSQHIP
uniref:Uncharacterized protein n=1 Tax=Rhizophora mucronata TaxID=61149 RepID=A0A2P2N9M0_RHIMU